MLTKFQNLGYCEIIFLYVVFAIKVLWKKYEYIILLISLRVQILVTPGIIHFSSGANLDLGMKHLLNIS